MEGMKPSGVDWIGDIPEEWEVSKINYLYELRREKVNDTDYPPLSVTMQGILPQLDTAAKTDAHDDRKRVCVGDFVINSRSDRRGSCGISPYDGSVSLINTVLEPRESMNSEYYNWLFHTPMFADEFYKQGNGIVDDLWSTNWTAMKDIHIVVPSFEEQNRIAQTLAKVVGGIDSASKTLDGQLDILQRYRASIIHEAVTRGLDPSVEMKPSGVDWIGEIPIHWTLKKVKNICTVRNGLDYHTEDTCWRNESDATFVVRSSNLKNGQIVFGDDVYVNKLIPISLRLKLGDLIIVRTNGSRNLVGKCALVSEDMNAVPGAFMMLCRTKYFEYMYWMFNSRIFSYYLDWYSTSTINQLSNYALCNISIPFCTDEVERHEICVYLKDKCRGIDSIIDTKQKQLEILKRRRSSLIFEYVTGKRRVD